MFRGRDLIRMTAEDLSWEERNHLYKLSAIPTLCVFFVILIYFNYLMYTDPLETRWEFVTLICLPFFIFFPTTFMVTFEILYHRKVSKPISFHLKRLVGQMFFLAVSASWFLAMLIIMQPVLSPIIGDRDFLVSSVLSLIIFAIVVVRFRKIIDRIDRAEW